MQLSLLHVCCCGPDRHGDIDRLLHGSAASECGQCHVVSIRRKLNTDSFPTDRTATTGEYSESALRLKSRAFWQQICQIYTA